MSIGFDRDRNRRQRQLTNNTNQKGKYHIRIILRDVFGFAEHHKKATYELRFKLTLTRNSDNSVLNKDKATNIRKIKFNSFEWYVPHCAASISQQDILSKHISSKVPTELLYVGRSVYTKEANTQI